MHRHISITILLSTLLLLLQSCAAEAPWLGKPDTDDRLKMDLRGPVFRLEELTFDRSGPPILTEGDTASREVWQFDSLGHLLDRTEWRSGNLYYHAEYQLNSHFQEIGYATYMGPEQSLQGQTSTDYHPNGLIREEQYFNKDKLLQRKTVYEYDDRYRLILERTEFYESASATETRYTYVDTSQVMATKTLLMDGRTYVVHYQDGKSYMTTNEYGAIIEQSKYDPASGHLISSTSLANDVIEYKAVFGRDTAGRITREATYNGQALLTRWVSRSYDSLGNVLTECASTATFDHDPPLPADTTQCIRTTYTYTYDALGNWTSCMTTENGKPIHERKRIIRYWFPEAEKPPR